jgi:hypothetical protein
VFAKWKKWGFGGIFATCCKNHDKTGKKFNLSSRPILSVISSEAPLHEKSPLHTAPPTKTFPFEH